MDLTQEFINQEVRRIVFSLKKASGEYVHIFSILENGNRGTGTVSQKK